MQTALAPIMRDYLIRFQQTAIKETGRRPLTHLRTPMDEKLVLTIPNVVFAAGSPPIDGPRGLRLNANFTAHRTTGEIGVTAVLRNALPTVY